MSGFGLLCWVYYGQASFFLIDPAVLALQPWQAALIGVFALALGWLVYDFLCKSPLANNDALLALVGFGFVVLMSFVFTQVFSGRGALVHTGALMATMMTANVFLVIMPNQRKSVAKLIAGETPDPKWAKESKVRSTHNNYITLPVLFMMLSNHYPITFSNRAAIPAVVICIVVAGALVRYFYNVWHAQHEKGPWWAWIVAALAIVAAFFVSVAASPAGRELFGFKEEAAPAYAAAKAPDAVVDVVTSRCAMCHADEPVVGGRRRGAEGGEARYARAHRRLRPGDPHAGGADPRDAAQQPDRNHPEERGDACALARAGPAGEKLKALFMTSDAARRN